MKPYNGHKMKTIQGLSVVAPKNGGQNEPSQTNLDGPKVEW